MEQVKVKVFALKDKKLEDIKQWILELDIKNYEIVNIESTKGKKQAKLWCINNKGSVPWFYFVNDKEDKTYYSDNTIKDKDGLKGAIKYIQKKYKNLFQNKIESEEIIDDN